MVKDDAEITELSKKYGFQWRFLDLKQRGHEKNFF